MTDDRSRVLARVRSALAGLGERTPRPAFPEGVATARGAEEPGLDLVEAFRVALERAGGRLFVDGETLAQWLTDRGAMRGYCDPRIADEMQRTLGPALRFDRALDRARIDDYAFGLTPAVAGIAETGTIVMNDAGTARRLGALAPWIHVALLRPADLVATVAEALRALGADPYVVWCTGPSKTADVEGILIQGVHGPGEQAVLLLAGAVDSPSPG